MSLGFSQYLLAWVLAPHCVSLVPGMRLLCLASRIQVRMCTCVHACIVYEACVFLICIFVPLDSRVLNVEERTQKQTSEAHLQTTYNSLWHLGGSCTSLSLSPSSTRKPLDAECSYKPHQSPVPAQLSCLPVSPQVALSRRSLLDLW